VTPEVPSNPDQSVILWISRRVMSGRLDVMIFEVISKLGDALNAATRWVWQRGVTPAEEERSCVWSSCLRRARSWGKASRITSEKKIAIFILYLIYIIFVYRYERILVGALRMPSTSRRRFAFCTAVPACPHLLRAPCLLPNTKPSSPLSLQERGFSAALCENEWNKAISGSFSQKKEILLRLE